jgi:hypothetical protein
MTGRFFMKLRTFIFSFILTIFFTSVTPSNPEWINVYVHGTMTTFGVRILAKIYPELGYGQQGVAHINQMPANALFLKDVDCLQMADAVRFNADHFYTFGWSGALNFKKREQAGKQLYDGLVVLLNDYHTKYGYFPKLRIITFSHGGNVALNMVQHLPFIADQQVHLEMLIIACPVQKVTQHLLCSTYIDKMYTIASTRDLLQIADRYTFEKKGYFPQRFFCVNQKNCKEIRVFVNNRGLAHIDLMRSFVRHIPQVLKNADLWFEQQQSCDTIFDCYIQDPQFRFYNGINLISAIKGLRKK